MGTSYALLAYFQAEPGGEKIRDLLRRAGAGNVTLALSLINLGETLYIVARRLGDEAAEETVRDILRLPIQMGDVSMERVLAAAHVKAHHAISFADSFAVSLANELSATVVTGDPEFEKVKDVVPLMWV
jgi:ribonuclease VapC